MPFRSLSVVMLILLAACAPGTTGQQVTSESLATPAPTAMPALPTAESTPDSGVTLTVWLPEPVAPANNQAAALVWAQQIDGFQAAQPDVRVQTRLKRAEGVGGVMATLLSASDVAPSALPDLTLIRRQDLGQVVQAGLAQPFDGRLSRAVTGDLYTAALRLGQAGGELHALSYALDIQHIAYEPPRASFARFEDVLAEGRPLVLPLGRVNGISDVFLVQYLAAGGTVVNGSLGTLNVNALRTVLQFYQQALAAGVIDPGVLNYPTPQEYQAGLVDGRIEAAVVTSGMYLDLLASGKDLETSPIPVSSDRVTTLVDGWMWVLTAKNADRQTAALAFLEWVFEADRQAAYTRAIAMLPSGRAAMGGWGSPAYAQFAGSLLANAVLPLDDNEGSATARALQNALVAVVSGERSADEAVEDVVDQLEG